jgi:hypothetical protein
VATCQIKSVVLGYNLGFNAETISFGSLTSDIGADAEGSGGKPIAVTNLLP